MAAILKIGQSLRGSLDTYSVTKLLHRSVVWRATGARCSRGFIVKTALPGRLENERDMLRRFHGHPYIRQLVDEIAEPPALVLEHLDDNLLAVSNSSRFTRPEVKFVARNVLEALQTIHEAGLVHTDVKPDNILVRLGDGPMRFTEAKLADCGNVYPVPPDADSKEEEGHDIGAPIFRSPEAMLNLRWSTPTDIWSFGATLISLIWGENWHIFIPGDKEPDDEDYLLNVLIQQVRIFGPWPVTYVDIAPDERLDVCTYIQNTIWEKELSKPFELANDKELTVQDKEFILKIMKLDPRDRPTAKQLLADEWFET